MSALTINKIACRAYGTLFLACGAMLWFVGIVAVCVFIFGASGMRELSVAVAQSGLDQKTFETYMGIGGAVILAVSAIPIVLGMFACRQRLWAMIVGTALWSLFAGLAILGDHSAKVGDHKFALASIAVFVLLTIAAIIWRRRPAASMQMAAVAA
jgi:hypothetical protein